MPFYTRKFGRNLTSFLALTDTPDSYYNQAGLYVRVNATEDGLEFFAVSAADEKVKLSAADPTAGYLNDKLSGGTGITYNNGLITNTAPDQTVSISAGTHIDSVTGTYPNFTINAATQTTDLSGQLHLDQTTPQTITGGIPLLTGLTPTTDYQIATKKYVDDTISPENLWDRTGTTLSTHNVGDNVLLTGTLGAGAITGTSIIKSGGTSSQFLKADGSVDTSTYLTSTALTSTYVGYGSAGNVLTGDANFTWDDSLKRLGIGTATPTATLQVVQGTAGIGTVTVPEEMAINVAPATDWVVGDIITGQTSGKTCVVVAKISSSFYDVKSRSGTYTNGEVVGVTGVGAKLADQNLGAPTFANGTRVYGVGTKFLNTFRVGDTITSAGQTKTVASITSDTLMTTDAWTPEVIAQPFTLAGGTRFSVFGNGNANVSGNFWAGGTGANGNHGFNVAPIDEAAVNILQTKTVATTGANPGSGLKLVQNLGGDNNASPKAGRGFNFQQNITGTNTQPSGNNYMWGINFLQTDSTAADGGSIFTSPVKLNYGGYFVSTWAGTAGYILALTVTGGYFESNGNMSATKGTFGLTHVGGEFRASGTADDNYGAFVTVSGATRNWGFFQTSAANNQFGITGSNSSFGVVNKTAPTAKIFIGAGTTAAGTAPIKLTQASSAILTAPEAGVIECNDGDNLHYTIKTGTKRKTVSFEEDFATKFLLF